MTLESIPEAKKVGMEIRNSGGYIGEFSCNKDSNF